MPAPRLVAVELAEDQSPVSEHQETAITGGMHKARTVGVPVNRERELSALVSPIDEAIGVKRLPFSIDDGRSYSMERGLGDRVPGWPEHPR